MAEVKGQGHAYFFKMKKIKKSHVPWAVNLRLYNDTDIDKLRETLPQFGLECDAPVEVTAETLEDELQRVAASRKKVGLLFVYIGAYSFPGLEDVIIGSDGIPIELKERITEIFSQENPALVSSEKIFFIQACCPGEYATNEEDDGDEAEPSDVSVPSQANITFYWSRIPGNVRGWDVKNHGTICVDQFCNILESKQGSFLLTDVFTEVNAKVAEELKRLQHEVNKLPNVTSTVINPTQLTAANTNN